MYEVIYRDKYGPMLLSGRLMTADEEDFSLLIEEKQIFFDRKSGESQVYPGGEYLLSPDTYLTILRTIEITEEEEYALRNP